MNMIMNCIIDFTVICLTVLKYMKLPFQNPVSAPVHVWNILAKLNFYEVMSLE